MSCNSEQPYNPSLQDDQEVVGLPPESSYKRSLSPDGNTIWVHVLTTARVGNVFDDGRTMSGTSSRKFLF